MRKVLLKLFVAACLLFQFKAEAQTYTNVYNGESYSSIQPYNLNIVYFVPNDIPLDPTYKKRLSALMLWGQNFYKQSMINNGYGPKTFGLFTETAYSDSVQILVINGSLPHTSYPYNNPTLEANEVNTFFTNNPTLKTSKHTLIITAVSDPSTASVPFYGFGTNCFALDYPDMDIQYMGASGAQGHLLTIWFGGLMHELGHGLNLPHSRQTNTENTNFGMNLMSQGNATLGSSPTFINRAGCAILNNCEVFAEAPGTTYYNGHNASIGSLHANYTNGNIIVAGKFVSNRTVTDVNFYQNSDTTLNLESSGYFRTAWSVHPIGADSFYISMPVNELYAPSTPNGPYHLEVELVLSNGETTFNYYPFKYDNGVPVININSVLKIDPHNKASLSLNCYPNPASTELNIKISNQEKIEVISLTDLYGRRIIQQEGPIGTINIAHLRPGVYVAEVRLKSGTILRQKVTKQ